MQVITIGLCALAFAGGHLIRDGFPALGHTHLARAGGAAACALGGFAVHGMPLEALFAFVGVLVGFYTDMRHGEGQQAARPSDAIWLTVSGVTSLAPLAVALAVLLDPWWAVLVAVGLLKPPIWFGCWRLFAPDTVSFEQPTRIAALAFGFCFGLAFAIGLALRGAT